jgi:hypothetical protein
MIMSKTITAAAAVSFDITLDMLRRLPALERLKVISIVLPEAEQELEKQLSAENSTKLKSLRGLWKYFNIDLSTEDIDEVCKEVWKNFPREDIL